MITAVSDFFLRKITLRGFLLDISALALVYFVPALTHLLALPVYLIEPMRLMLILALAHTSRTNSYLLALTMPAFSFLISAHPVLPKMMLITLELLFNVLLFHLLVKRTGKIFLATFLSIFISKSAYYLVKFFLVQAAIIGSGVVDTPLAMQLVTALLFSGYAALFFKPENLTGR